VVIVLLAAEAAVNAKDSEGQTALHNAGMLCSSGEVYRRLFGAGRHVNATCDAGMSVFHTAAMGAGEGLIFGRRGGL
jgi:ankyrin repeat protein